MGAQFTEKEGERLIQRAYNPKLSEAENARRIGALADSVQESLEAKRAAAEYFEQNGTLRGYSGSVRTRLSDIESAFDRRIGQGNEQNKKAAKRLRYNPETQELE